MAAIGRPTRGLVHHDRTPGGPRPSAALPFVDEPAAFVDPLIGTSGTGNCFPGAALPFGMIQWSPDTRSRPCGGGYEYDDSTITGFSLTHLSGPGCPVFGDLPILPTLGEVESPWVASADFSHDQEEARPGSYAVTLTSGARVRLTVSMRAGIGEFGFPAGRSGNLLVKLTGSATPVAAAAARVVGDDEISGEVTSGRFCGGPNTYTLFFVMRFDRPLSRCGVWRGTSLSPGAPEVTSASEPAGLYVTFDAMEHESTVRVRVALSYVSAVNARENLSAEVEDLDFTAVRDDAHARWNDLLRRIEIAGGDERDQRIFYTALYHALLHPNVCSDTNGEYLGFDHEVHVARAGHAQYANFSGWDIYRTQIPLIALLAPRETSDAVQSMVDAHAQSGLLPKWSVANGEAFIMVGDPAAPIIAGAHAFGARGFDTAAALTALLEQARRPNAARPGLDYLDERRFLPLDGTYGCCNFYGPVSSQLEYDVADFAVAAYAEALGEEAAAAELATRAQNWLDVFDPSAGFLRPKLETGQFLPEFDPAGELGFVEGNAWQYTPTVPFNVGALIRAMGGERAFVAYLDALFDELNAERAAPYAWMGNEPCLGIPWLYDYAGVPHQTQALVRRIQRELYTDAPDGLPGNDDLGTMSAWFVWSALGCYPVTPGVADLALGSPVFPSIRIHMDGGREIAVDAPDAAHDAPYVRGLELNGKPWTRAYLPASVVTYGARLRFRLGSRPDPGWAAAPEDAPPSFPAGQPPALGFVRPGYRVVVPGEHVAAVTLAARQIADDPQTVTWSATVPDGVLVRPSQGSLRTRLGEDATVTLNLHATRKRGSGLVTVRLATADGIPLPDVLIEVSITADA